MPEGLSVFVGLGPPGEIGVDVLESRLDPEQEIADCFEAAPGQKDIVGSQLMTQCDLA